MDQNHITTLTRSLSNRPSRRDALRGLVVAGFGLGALRLSNPVEAKNKKKRNKRKNQQDQQTPQTPQTPPAICQSGTQVGAVSVPATGTSVNTPVLTAGQRYRLRASGFWSSNATHGQDAFADFEFANPAAFVTTFEGVRLGLAIDGGSADVWGSYSTGHVYEREVTGQGAALALRCSDKVHTDNSGSVLVEVLCA